MFNIVLLNDYKKQHHGDDGGWEGDPLWAHIVVLTPTKYQHDVAKAAANRGFRVILIPDGVLMFGDSWGIMDLRHPASTIWHTPV